jgi:predicted permease
LTLGSLTEVRLDVASFAFTLALSTITGLVFGLVPAWQTSRVPPNLALRQVGSRTTSDRRQHRVRKMLVVTQVAIAIVLLVGAGLFLRTLSNLVRVDLGFEPSRTITMGLFLPHPAPEARVSLIDRILQRVRAVPGVQGAGTIQLLPLTGMNCGTGFWLEGQGIGNSASALSTECSLVSAGYLSAMAIPVLEGRPFESRDRLDTPRVLLVNRTFATRYFPAGRAVGRRILVQASNQELAEIVGVVGNVRHSALTSAPVPTVYLLHAQTPGYISTLVVRTAGDPVVQATAIRRAIHEVDPTQAVSTVKTMLQYVDEALARPRLYAMLLTCFAVIAVILAAIGIYGLLAYIVAQRRHEIGIRIAIGATRAQVFSQLARQGVLLTLAGVLAGVVAAAGLRGAASSFLYGVTPLDPATYAQAVLVLAGVGCAAAVVPAFWATRLDPTSALRSE